MKKMFMLALSILAINSLMVPATMRQYQDLMKIISHDDAGAFKTFLDKNPDFKSNDGENLTLAPTNNTPPIVYMIQNAAINCLRYALDAKLLQLEMPYKFLDNQTIMGIAKSMIVDNPKSKKTFAFLVEYQSQHPQLAPAPMSKKNTLQMQLDVMKIIDKHDAKELEMIASENPRFDWSATMVGFVNRTKLPNMTPLAYAQWKNATDCIKVIQKHLAITSTTRPVSTARRANELRERFSYNT